MRPSTAILAGCLLLSSAGCGGDAEPAARDEPAKPTAPPAISAQESRRVLDEWTTRHNEAVGSDDAAAWRTAVTGALGGVVTARVITHGGLEPSAEIALHNPVFYVPRVASYPKWFAVAALQQSGGAGRQALLLFTRGGAKEEWRVAHSLTFKDRPPQVKLDEQGYAVTAPDGGLPAAHAAYLTSGQAGDAFIADTFSARGRAPKFKGWSSTHRFAAGEHGTYALRTADGGALVWYDIEQSQQLTSTGGGRRTLPPALRDYLVRKPDVRGSPLTASWTWQVLGYLPPSGAGRAMGQTIGLTDATGG